MKQKKCYSYIRFSSDKQKHGDSLRRQLQLSKEYAKKNGLILDTTLNMKDLGLSAYKGEHTKKGALGEFFALVKLGKIEKGSILIVESLDRLSREKISVSLNQFTSLLDAHISIATLQDNQLYTPEYDLQQLMYSIMIMSRAYEESKAKQARISASWEIRRKNIRNKILTSKSPHWLQISKEKSEFLLLPDRVRLLQRIFKLYLDGNGVETISKIFNKEKIPTWGRSNLWGKSYIWKILRARTVIGEYQPKKFNENGRSVDAGDAIENYYPHAINHQIFYKVQDQLVQRRGKFGRIGACVNLFPHIAKCGYCSSSMTYVNKGGNFKYLVCEQGRRGGNCGYHTIRYQEFEDAFLQTCRKLCVKDLISDTKNETEARIISLKDELNSYKHKIKESENKIDNWMNLYGNLDKDLRDDDIEADVRETILTKIKNEHEVINSTKVILKEKTKLVSDLQRRNVNATKDLETVQENIRLLGQQKEEELGDIRTKVKAQIERLVKRIDVYSIGELHDIPDFIKALRKFGGTDSDVKKYENNMKKENENANRERRCFKIFFKDGGQIIIRNDSITDKYIKTIEIDEHQKVISSTL